MASNVRPLRKKEIRRENEKLILDAAEKVFAEAGFGGATMQLIADVAGLPKANLHYYFPTKEALYRQVVQNIFTDWLRAADVFDAASGPAESKSGCAPRAARWTSAGAVWSTIGALNRMTKFVGLLSRWSLIHASRVGNQ